MTIVVSVVVPTRDRPELLNRCLAALVVQDFDPTAYEIIVTDDGPSLATQRLVEEWVERIGYHPATGKGAPRLGYLPVTQKHGPAAARNRGWQQAAGDMIAFTDDDCIPDRHWLSAGIAAFQPNTVGVSGRLIVPLETVPTDYERNAAELGRAAFVTANCFYRRSAIAQINGFDERFTMPWREDSDLLFTLMEQLGIGGDTANLMEFPFIPGQGWIEVPNGQQRSSKLVHAPDAIVVHPVRPAAWGVSLSQQRKNSFNALLYKKHPALYRQWLPPVRPWPYYAIVSSLLIFLLALLSQGKYWVEVAIAAISVWFIFTTRFCLHRLQETSHTPSHVTEMVITSILIPPLSLFWRLQGAIQFQVFFF